VDAEPKLLLAALRDGARAARAAAAARRADTVLYAAAVVVERREDRAVVELDRAEVAVRDRDEPLARDALLGGHDLGEGRVIEELGRVRERLRHVRQTIDDRLDLGDLPVLHLDAKGEIRGIAVLLDDAEPDR